MRKPHRLVRLANPIAARDGKHLAVQIETEDAATFDLEVPLSEVGTLVQFFVAAANHVQPDAQAEQLAWTPIAVNGLGLAAGRDQNETLLVVRLGGFDLAFSLDSTKVAELGASFARTAQVLSANDPKAQ